jgi:hypothetical protein
MRVARFLIELLILLVGSITAGFLIGTIQHFVAFGVWGYGFAKDSLKLARLEGGLLGGIFGIPTGLIAYYAVLKRRATPKLVAAILGGSLVGGCALGIGTFWLSAFLTPILNNWGSILGATAPRTASGYGRRLSG